MPYAKTQSLQTNKSKKRYLIPSRKSEQALVLEADDPVVLGDQLRSLCRHGKLGVLVGKVLIGYPATAGTEASYVDGDLCRKYLGHKLLEWRKANTLHVVRYGAVHQHNGVANQDDGRLVPGTHRPIGHKEWKGRLGRVFATV